MADNLENDLKKALKRIDALEKRVSFVEKERKIITKEIATAIGKEHKGMGVQLQKDIQNATVLIKRDMLFEMRSEIKKSK